MAKEATPKREAASRNSVAANREKRLAATTAGRFATIRSIGKDDGDKDVRDEVINIAQFEPGHFPELPELEKDDAEYADKYSVEEVPEGVLIGMRRGGKYLSVAGFGWRDEADFAAHGSPAGQGSARLADVGAG